MKIVVLKFGGTSVGTIERIKKVCKLILSFKKKIQSDCCHICHERYDKQLNKKSLEISKTLNPQNMMC